MVIDLDCVLDRFYLVVCGAWSVMSLRIKEMISNAVAVALWIAIAVYLAFFVCACTITGQDEGELFFRFGTEIAAGQRHPENKPSSLSLDVKDWLKEYIQEIKAAEVATCPGCGEVFHNKKTVVISNEDASDTDNPVHILPVVPDSSGSGGHRDPPEGGKDRGGSGVPENPSGP